MFAVTAELTPSALIKLYLQIAYFVEGCLNSLDSSV